MAQHRRTTHSQTHDVTPASSGGHAHRAAHRTGRGAGTSGARLLGGAAVAAVVATTAGLGLMQTGSSGATSNRANDIVAYGAVDGAQPSTAATSPSSSPTRTASSSAQRRHKPMPKSRTGSRLSQRTSSSAPSSSTTAHHPDPGGPSSCVSQRQGIPASGAYVGGAVGGTRSLSTVEKQANRPLAIHRTYYSAGQVDYAIRTVEDDLAQRRLPWISFKMPYSWSDMAAGRGDAWAAGVADKLAKVGGPVWLAFHHEPEGEGSMQAWKRMQQHLAPIVHAHAHNVAYTVIYMGWNSFSPQGPSDQHVADTFPGGQYVDIIGVDLYNRYGAKSNVHENLDPMRYFGPIAKFARSHGTEWAIGEMGYTKKAAQADPDWLQSTYRDLRAEGGLALSYFDSSRHSMANWTLDDPLRFNAFDSLLDRSPRVCSS